MDAQNNGAIELCAFKQFIPLLEYFIELNNETLPVWRNLVKFTASDVDEESEAASKCLYTLTMKLEGYDTNQRYFFFSIFPISTAAKGYDCAFCDKSANIGTLVVLYI